ncbi:Flp family type IVb pilin [Mesorhizobium amorphae]|uniref:Flp/Fap pilin component n=1 Tax=Mesorhizobium amorphae CCNWGS0123 TaxID=1082933 RepID=G6Y9F8_9HYPH|nr:Flp family type IVb pilin [Mesorhizobium amorphae]ANT51757.1 pilin [Mesorhizobium amorphae CCNWGS0123]EHH11664.1 Flp/Fap pilin component [Mesorhizobium amorphae CCNWGS0123]GLR44365.1 pilin [Mesorhizobium amorphae]
MTKLLKQFRDDDSGAAMVEYSILVGIIAAASILAILAIGGWVTGRFTGLCANLEASPLGTCNVGTGVGT